MADRLETVKPNKTYSQAQLLSLSDQLDQIEDAVVSAKAEVSSCVRRRTGMRKQIEAAGIPLDVFDHVREQLKRTAAERERFSQHSARISKFYGQPVGYQSSFGDDDEPTEEDRKAFSVHQLKAVDSEGYAIGRAGNPADNPHDPGTEPHSRWLNAWNRGQADYVKAQHEAPPAATGKRRGRPPAPGKSQTPSRKGSRAVH